MTMLVFTDGSCIGNPGPGGWAALICCQGIREELSGSFPHTTNNRMELTAAIQGVSLALTHTPESIRVFSDSKYVIQGITEWIAGWLRNGWRTSQKKPVENRDLWEELLCVSKKHSALSWEWVKGHNGHPENEHVNMIAQRLSRIAQMSSGKFLGEGI